MPLPLLDPQGTVARTLASAATPPLKVPAPLRKAIVELEHLPALACGLELASLPGLSASDHLPLLWLATLLFSERSDGHSFVSVAGSEADALEGRLRRLGADDATIETTHALLRRADTHPLFGPSGSGRPFVVTDGRLALHADEAAEQRLARTLRQRFAVKSDLAGDDDRRRSALAYAAGRMSSTHRLDPEQVAALELALSRGFTVISGGPGTGKTTIVLSLLRALAHAGQSADSLCLAAPTGKAANRMSESIRAQLVASEPIDDRLRAALPKPQTLHRLLGYSPSTGRYRHHAGNPVAAALVVVDEASMVDLDLFDHLLRALAPTTSLLLLGDADQLPSVESGAIFRDLVRDPPLPGLALARLRTSHRLRSDPEFGGHILRFANTVNDGKVKPLEQLPHEPVPTVPVRRSRADEVAFAGVEWLGDAKQVSDLQHRWFDRLRPPGRPHEWRRTWRLQARRVEPDDTAALDALITESERSRVLCAQRDHAGGSGMEAWNEALHGRLATYLGEQGSRAFLPGEPAIITRNDYNLGLFNGDVGLVVNASIDRASPQLAFVVRRSDGLAAFPLTEVRDELDRAWALTVHRAQGSECENVLVSLPAKDTELWTRELLYTAVTRAKKGVVLVGNGDRLHEAAIRPVTRRSALRALLGTPAPGA